MRTRRCRSARRSCAGVAEIVGTIRHLRGDRTLLWFLLAYWFYIDGVNTIIKMAVDYGLSLGLKQDSLITALLLVQFIGFPAALVFGWLGKRIGPRTGIFIGIAVYTGAAVYAYFLDSEIEFYGLAVVIGLVQGGVQSLSRSLFGRLVPAGQVRRVLRVLQPDGQGGRDSRADPHRCGRAHDARFAARHRVRVDPVRHWRGVPVAREVRCA